MLSAISLWYAHPLGAIGGLTMNKPTTDIADDCRCDADRLATDAGVTRKAG